jgi:FkbM family methyltransferase
MKWLNEDTQCDAFVEAVVAAYNSKYVHQQKMYACNQVKDICTWATVALQWKQRMFKIAGEYLPVDEYRKVDYINKRVRKVFGRRFYNGVEDTESLSASQKHIAIISPVFNAETFVNRCIRSVAQQDYHNYTMYLINDASTDNSLAMIEHTIRSLPESLWDKFKNINREERTGSAVFNQIDTLRTYVTDGDAIVMFLDGDDWLVSDATIFQKYNNVYHQGAEFTYGSCWSVVDGIPLVAQPYPPEVKATKNYRNYRFNWQMPYTHLRTFQRSLLDNLSDEVFKDEQGQWYCAGGDNATFYNLIEQADPDRVICIPDIVYNYNDTNPLNDYKVNGIEQNQTAAKILAAPQSKAETRAPDPVPVRTEITTITKANTPMKRILVGIPTARYIEPDTFKSIFDLIVPAGYELDFQYFYGYNVDQVRNLIADWTVRGYDYLFSVDHDIAFAPDTLVKLLSHDKPMVTGVYRQRLDPEILEVYDLNGGNMPYSKIKSQHLVEVGGCGFGCVLVKKEVFAAVGYPQFVYHSALDHRNTLSEDVDFCIKARQKGFGIWCDPSVLCDHHGQRVFRVNTDVVPERVISQEEQHLRDVSQRAWLPQEHCAYLSQMKQTGIEPKVIYDIGSCVLHWTNEAKKHWPQAEFLLFEAMSAVEPIYKETGYKYFLGPLGEQDGMEVDFYENLENPGGNSYFRENPELSPNAPRLFPESSKKRLTLSTLDTLIRKHNLPLPQLIKMDIQGAELAVLKGASLALSQCDHLILELQHRDYNLGAPKRDEVMEYLRQMGYECVSGMFSGSEEGSDGDYHFVKTPRPQILSQPMPLKVVTLELPGFGS